MFIHPLRFIEIVLTSCPDNLLGGKGIIWTTRIDYLNWLFQLSEQPKGDKVPNYFLFLLSASNWSMASPTFITMSATASVML